MHERGTGAGGKYVDGHFGTGKSQRVMQFRTGSGGIKVQFLEIGHGSFS